MNIQMVDLKRQYKKYQAEFDQAIRGVMESAQYINGPDVRLFAEEMQRYLGVQYAIPCANGTDALQIALMSLDIKPGDEVITTPFTFIATAETIALLGARPVYVDIDEKTYNIDPNRIEDAITPKTRAIIPVHLYGQPADMDPILEVAARHNLAVIEDAAQAVGSTYKGKAVTTFGQLGCISFFPSKNLGAAGDAGMIVTNDEHLAKKARMIANHGSQRRYQHEILGVNSRLDSLQAAILRIKLKYLDEWNKKRREIARYYNQGFQNAPVQTPYAADYGYHIYHQYTIQVENRDGLQERLNSRGIPHAVHYPIPLHLQPAFRELCGYREGDFPVAERAAKRVISLPMHPELTREEQDYIIEVVQTFVTHQAE
ncbi:MAG: DegT/DnrJ/EryC1/StrS family aminotransferase [Calditrichia bacterium]